MATRDIRTRKPASDLPPHSAQAMRPLSGSGKRSNAIRLLLAVAIGGSSFAAAGCTATSGVFRKVRRSDCVDELMIGYRNRTAAEKAWLCRRGQFGAQANNDVFKAGFIAGYLDIAEGGRGCTPPFAPEKYWGWRYQSLGGRSAVGSWFAGFPLGVQAAEEEGLGTFTRLPHCGSGCPDPTDCGCNTGLPATTVPMVDYNTDMPAGVTAEQPYYSDGPVDMTPPPAIMPDASAPAGPAATPAPATEAAPTATDKLELDASAPAMLPPFAQAKDANSLSDLTAPEARIANRPDAWTPKPSQDDASLSIEEIFGTQDKASPVVEETNKSLPFSFE